MRFHLFAEARVATPGCEGVANPGEKAIHGSHGRSSALTSKKRAMTAVFCSQFVFSDSRSF